MVASFTDLRDGDVANLIYLVLSGLTTRPTLPASLQIKYFYIKKQQLNKQLLHLHLNLANSWKNAWKKKSCVRLYFITLYN